MTTYLLQVILCSALLLAVYRWVLQNEKMYAFNRFFLLFGLVFSAVLPLVSFELPFSVESALPAQIAPAAYFSHQAITSAPLLPTITSPTSTDYSLYWWGLYALVTSVLLGRFCRNIYQLWANIQQNTTLKHHNLSVVLLKGNTLPYSFWNYVFVNQTDFEAGQIEREIWSHEEAHVRQKHSFDVLLVELLMALFWFNPVVWLYRKAILLNHELLADDWVVKIHQNTHAYQYLLLRSIRAKNASPLSSSFNYFITKTRLVMITKITSPARAWALQLAALAVVVALVFVFGDVSLAQKRAVATKAPTPFSAEGATPEAMAEYAKLVQKYLFEITANNGEKRTRLEIPTETDRARLELLFKSMNKAQQDDLDYVMHPPLGPMPRITPTEKEYEAYKNPKIYGVWIDDKKVPNTKLDNYKAADFSQVFVSRLYKNAQATIGYKYKIQLNLETTAYYERNRSKALADKKYFLWQNMEKWKRSVKQKNAK
jgi:bla regulator protein blaR1